MLASIQDDMPQSSNSDSELVLEDGSAIVHVESRASVPPLEVVLDDMEEEDVAGQPDNRGNDSDDVGENLGEKSNTLAKRKAKEEKERKIRLLNSVCWRKMYPEPLTSLRKLLELPQTAASFGSSTCNLCFLWLMLREPVR